ncbi:hypothetical protein Aperf_G00000070582 [Anoplocephala perfoliata]
MQPLYAGTSSLATASAGWGYASIIGLTIGYGTMYLPTKKYDTGSGMVFQWVLCTSMAFTLLGIHICAGSARIWALSVLSGVFWASGNVMVVPIIKRLGMGVGMLIWSMVNVVMGWAVFRFGWFGVQPEVPKDNTLNIIGVIFAALSIIAYAFITPGSASQESVGTVANVDNEVPRETEQNVTESTGDADSLLQHHTVSFIRRFWASQIVQRLIGIFLSFVSGTLYGICFVPINYVQENYPNASQRGIDYVAALGLGTFLAATVFLVLYLLVILLWNKFRRCTSSEESREIKPDVGKEPFMVTFLPSMLAGALSGMAFACNLVANEALSPAIIFPISGTLPGALATLIGALFYREVRGRLLDISTSALPWLGYFAPF